MYNHHTATCPNCGKDSYESEAKAFFSVAQCTWCNSYFKWDAKSKTYVVTDKKTKDK